MHDYEAIDRTKLYEGGACRICGTLKEDDGNPDHTDDCPGRILDALTYEIVYEGHGTHGDRGVEGGVRGDDLPKLYTEVAKAVLEHGRHDAELRWIVELTRVDEEVAKERVRLVAEIVAEREKRAQKIVEAKALLQKERANAIVVLADRLAKGAVDANAFDRELAAIDAKYKGRL